MPHSSIPTTQSDLFMTVTDARKLLLTQIDSYLKSPVPMTPLIVSDLIFFRIRPHSQKWLEVSTVFLLTDSNLSARYCGVRSWDLSLLESDLMLIFQDTGLVPQLNGFPEIGNLLSAVGTSDWSPISLLTSLLFQVGISSTS